MNAIYSTNRKFKRMIVNLLGILVILAIVLSATGGVFAQETDPPEAIDYVVTTTDDNDDGTCDGSHCSLREAINAANDNLAADMITFDIPGEGPFTIQPLSGLPEITDSVTIDGTTQPGFRDTPVVELDGSSAGEEVIGLVITAGDSTVRGLVINRFTASGILLWGNGGNTIEGNFLGTDTSGAFALGNAFDGVSIGESPDNLIEGNVISGSGGSGISMAGASATGNMIRGNLIGTNSNGSAALPNFDGVWLGGSTSNNTIGGTITGEGNLISGNTIFGISVNAQASANLILGNFIGTDKTAAERLGNNAGGVFLSQGSFDNAIGGTQEGAGNLISGNGGNGVTIVDPGTTGNTVQGNLIGTDVTGTTGTGPPGPAPGPFTVTALPETCPTYPEGTDFEGFVSESGDPLAPWSGTSVHFVGTEECGSPEKLGEASLIYRYRIEFDDVTPLTSVAVSGAAFNGPDSVLRVLDEDMNVLGSVDTFGGNSFQVPFITLDDVEGKVFYVDEIDTSSTWRFRQSIVVNGSLPLGNLGSGVLLGGGASDNLIGGADPGAGNLISGSRFDGVALFGPETTDNKVQGNLIGTDADGTAALPNGAGVWIGDGALNTLVGGADEGAGNLISGNRGDGVSINHLETTGTRVLGNHIGTDRSGDAALPNGAGGLFVGASQTWIGGAEPGAGNVISGNAGSGIHFPEGASGNFVQGNYIGTDASGMNSLGNAFNGIFIGDNSIGNTIGGMDPGEGNTIAFNGGTGIGTSMEAGPGNTFLSNSVFLNGGLGIDLGEDGVTPNDPGDSDEGPNELQNFPFLSPPVAVGGSVRVTGVLWSTPRTSYRIEFFSVMTCDESGYGEGDTFLGFRKVTAGASGFAPFVFPLPRDFSLDAFVTATATNPSGSTSEFSRCVGPAK